MTDLKKTRSTLRKRANAKTTLEQLSPEIFFDVFDYLTGNEIYKSFYGLNSRFNQLVNSTPNVHLDLSRTKTKTFRSFQKIFCEQNIISVVLLYENVTLLETFFSSPDVRRFKSLSLLAVPLHAFKNRIPALLNIFKDKLINLKIVFSDMKHAGTGAQAAQSFAYILTELPLLKNLTLEYPKGIHAITYMPSTIVNNTIVSLTIWLCTTRLIPILYRFQKLKRLTLYYCPIGRGKQAVPPSDITYYRSQIKEKTSIEYPATLRHVNVYGFYFSLGTVEKIFQTIIPPNLLTLSLFGERGSVKNPIPRRQPPFLDGTQWHDLLNKCLPSTMKRVHIKYVDVDDTMSRTNLLRVKKEFIQYAGPTVTWELSFKYDNVTKLMSFDLNFI